MRRSSPIARPAWSGWLVALLLAAPSLADDIFPTLTIAGNGHDLGETPIFLNDVGAKFLPGNYVFANDDGKTFNANIQVEGLVELHFAAILNPVPAQGTRTFKVFDPPTPFLASDGVQMIDKGKRIEVRVRGELVTEYIPDDGPKPYFYPLIGPLGAAMTRSFPMKKVDGEKSDHPHHRSLWFTHGSVNKVDFWSEAPNHGRIVETSRPKVEGGLAMGLIRTTDDWIGPDGVKVCEDERVVKVWATRKTRVLDFDITLKATEGPVTFGDTKEGMFGLRVSTSMDVTSKQGGKIITSEGLEDTKAWGKPAAWVDYFGPVDGKTVGVAILNHPSSFRAPTTWHVRDYGLFAANPFGYHDFGRKDRGDFVLPKGETITFRYRVILHDGDAASAHLPAAFSAYAEPPKVVIR
jgi:hypothetical protein